MPSGTPKRLAGPVALTNTLTTNVYNQGSALVYDVVKHIHVVNKTAGAVTFSLWLGGTGGNVAGTELFNAHSVAAQSEFDWYGNMRMDSTDFLVGGASANTSLTIEVEGERFAV
jgi:hypothetical protein